MRLIDADHLIDTIGAMIGYGTTPITWEWGCKKYITIAYMVTIRGVTYWDSKLQHEFEPLNVLAWMPLPKPWKGANDE